MSFTINPPFSGQNLWDYTQNVSPASDDIFRIEKKVAGLTPYETQYIDFDDLASAIGASGAVWGSITGTLSDQLDLQTALDDKAKLSGANTFTSDQLTDASWRVTFGLVNGLFGTDGALKMRVGTLGLHSFDVITNNITAISVDSSQNSTFSGEIKPASLVSGSVSNNSIFEESNDIFYKNALGTVTSLTASGGTASWGGISGTLSDQTDLQDELDLKSNKNAYGFRGGGVKFDGLLRYYTLDTTQTFTSSQNWSVAVRGTISNTSSISCITGTRNIGTGTFLGFSGTNIFIEDNNNDNITQSVSLIQNEIYNLVITSNSGSVTLYFNGENVGSGSLSGDLNFEDLARGFTSTDKLYSGIIETFCLYNKALSSNEVGDLFANGLGAKQPYSLKNASQTVKTSGALLIDKIYIIDTYVAGDDFVNVGGANISGTVFTSIGTTPNDWTNGSSLRQLGCYIEYNKTSINEDGVFDQAIDGIDASPTGNPIIISRGDIVADGEIKPKELVSGSVRNNTVFLESDALKYKNPLGTVIDLTASTIPTPLADGRLLVTTGVTEGDFDWNSSTNTLDNIWFNPSIGGVGTGAKGLMYFETTISKLKLLTALNTAKTIPLLEDANGWTAVQTFSLDTVLGSQTSAGANDNSIFVEDGSVKYRKSSSHVNLMDNVSCQIQTADDPSTSTTYSTSELILPCENFTYYSFEIFLRIDQTSASSGIRLRIVDQSDSTFVEVNGLQFLSNGLTTFFQTSFSSSTGEFTVSNNLILVGTNLWKAEGTIKTGASNSQVRLQFAQNVATGTTTLKKGSKFTLTKIRPS